MATIKKMPRYAHDQLFGTSVLGFGGRASLGTPQEVVVVCEPYAVIQPHRHSVDAEMFVVAGEAEVLSSDIELNGKYVSCGDVVCFERDIDHGFKASAKGLVFISRNGGIVDEGGDWDMMFTNDLRKD
jgi:quercetin dioxygenase-like cupin family protein